jgi:hemoglobin
MTIWCAGRSCDGDETCVVRIHSGNGPHEEMGQRAIACFDQALEDAGLVRDERSDACCTITSRGPLLPRWLATAEDVPNGLGIPKWSWHGLVSGGETDDI